MVKKQPDKVESITQDQVEKQEASQKQTKVEVVLPGRLQKLLVKLEDVASKREHIG